MTEQPIDIAQAIRVRRRPPAPRASRAVREAMILQATIELVGEVGIADAHISDIAERAGMSPGHVLYYFPTKDSLLLGALVVIQQQLVSELEEEESEGTSPLESLRQFLVRSAPSGAGDTRYMLFLSMWERAARDDQVHELVTQILSIWVGVIERLLTAARDVGEIECDDITLEAHRLAALHDGLAIAVLSAAPFITQDRMLEILEDEIERLRARNGAGDSGA